MKKTWNYHPLPVPHQEAFALPGIAERSNYEVHADMITI